MNVKLITLAAAVSALALTAGSANAVVTFNSNTNTDLDYELHNTGAQTAPTVTLDTDEGLLVALTATTDGLPDDLNQGGVGMGFAIVNGTPLFDSVKLDPTNFDAFTALQFFLQYEAKAPNPAGGNPAEVNINYGTFDLTYTLVGGGGGSFNDFLITGGVQRFTLSGSADEQFATVTLSDLKGAVIKKADGFEYPAGFQNIRQLSFNADVGDIDEMGVPEPATWAMMIMGFGGVGALMRRRRLALA